MQIDALYPKKTDKIRYRYAETSKHCFLEVWLTFIKLSWHDKAHHSKETHCDPIHYQKKQHGIFPVWIISGKLQLRCHWSFLCVSRPVSPCVYRIHSLMLCSFIYSSKFPAQTKRHHLHHKPSDSYRKIRLPLYLDLEQLAWLMM